MPFFVLKRKRAVQYLTLFVILLHSSPVHADAPDEGLRVAYSLVQHLNIAPEMDVRAAIDAVVVWRCPQ